jgi:integrase
MHLRTLSLAAVKLANDDHDTRAIQAYLGHRNIQKTTRHTAAAPALSKEFFRD